MRRSTRLGLAVAVLLLVIAIGGYTVFWFIAAGRIADGAGEWAQSLRAQNLDLSWNAIRVRGFPLAFRVELAEARLRPSNPGGAAAPAAELRVPLLSGSTRPWGFRVWHLAAPDGLSAQTGSADAPTARLTAPAAIGSLAVGAEGGATLWLDLSRPSADAGVRLAARDAGLWLVLPSQMPQAHAERGIGFALDLREVTLPTVPAPFRNPVDEVAIGVTLMGAIPAAAPRLAAAEIGRAHV